MPLLVDAVRALAPDIRAASATIEQTRRLPPALVASLADTGVFRACVPHALGGLEAHPAILVEAIEAAANADGSTGWCTMIGATTGIVAAYLPADEGRAIFAGHPRVITGGVFAPRGLAVPEGAGFRVNGRWSFASGCQHCDWLMGGCLVQTTPAVPPRMMIVPASEATILDTWDTAGLRGTGSHDIVIEDRFVPAARSVSLVGDRPRAEGPLYRFPVFGLLAVGISAVTLGIARAAIDTLLGVAATKVPGDGRRTLAERGVIQAQVAQATAQVEAARAYLLDRIDRAWERAECDGEIPPAERLGLRMAATHATTAAAQAVDLVYAAGGGSAVYSNHPLQRHFRDVHTATAHAMVAQSTWELAGRLLLGLPTDVALL